MVDEREPRTREETVPLTPGQPINLDVRNSSGEIRLIGRDREDILIRSTRNGDSDSQRRGSGRLRIDADGNNVAIRVDEIHGDARSGKRRFIRGVDDAIAGVEQAIAEIERAVSGTGWSGSRVSYDIAVEAPREWVAGLRVGLHSASGPIAIDDLSGHINVRTASGDITTHGVSGELTIQTASGDLRAESGGGSMTVRTASGDAQISGRLERFGFTAASGDLHLDGTLASPESSSIQTVSGDVELNLRGVSGASLTFHTVSGDANIKPPFEKTGRRQWRLGDGQGPQLEVKTVSGDLRAGANGAETMVANSHHLESTMPLVPMAPLVPQVPPMPPVASKPGETGPVQMLTSAETEPTAEPSDDLARLELLRALERGEIDVEEALATLDSIQSASSAG